MYAPEEFRRDAYFWSIDADSLFLIYKINADVYAATEHKPGDSIVVAEDNQKLKRAFLYKVRYAHYIKLAYTPELIQKCPFQLLVVLRCYDGISRFMLRCSINLRRCV